LPDRLKGAFVVVFAESGRTLRRGVGAFFSVAPAACAIAVVMAASAARVAAGDDGASLSEVKNFHRISDALLTSGQVYPEHLPALSGEGVELVINLAVADPERNGAEALAVADAGISYVNIPVDWKNPTMEDLQLFFAMMDARGSRTTLVHCFANFRASAFTYLYRVLREGVPQEVARADLDAVWFEEKFEENPVWREFIDTALQMLP
jgi:protein tyrosine phosphatase (PTP) superfamily phosphohydrolase (DUF442 family)